MMDGTFSICPPMFSQLYIIGVLKQGVFFPTAFALLAKKSKKQYVRLFEKLVELYPRICPLSVSIDFEKAMFRAVKKVFGEFVEIYGCHFHFQQSIYRNSIRKKHQDENIDMLTREIIHLPFLKVSEVGQAFRSVKARNNRDYSENHGITRLYKYFQKCYLGNAFSAEEEISQGITNPSPDGYSGARFHPKTWNVMERSPDCPFTNNA